MKKMHRLASIMVIIAMLASMVPALSEAQELPVDALEPEEVWGEYDEVDDLGAFELGDIAFLEDADSEEPMMDADGEPDWQDSEPVDEADDPEELPLDEDAPVDGLDDEAEETEDVNDLLSYDAMPGAEEDLLDAEETAEEDVKTGIQLEHETLTLGVGETINLGAVAVYEGEEAPVLTYATSNVKIAKVTEDGTVKGIGKGEATITVSTEDGAQAECLVTVMKAPDSISLNAKKAVLGFDAVNGAGMTFQLVPKLSKDSASAIIYKGYSASVVHVDENGLITAVGVGRTTVYAKTFNGKKAQIEVVVKAAPNSIQLSKNSLTLGAGDAVTLTTSVPKDTISPIEIISDNPDCATINPETGEVKAIAPGSATIIACTFNGQRAECEVTVYEAADRVEISETEHALGVGEAFTLSARPMSGDVALDSPLTYATANKAIAVVDANGKVTGKKKGATTIKVTAMSGASAECTINVGNAPGSISLNSKKVVLGYDAAQGLGMSFQLVPKLPKDTTSAIIYKGYSASVVNVDENGLITAVGVGRTNVSATTYNGKKAQIEVVVKAAPASVKLSKSSLTLGAGDAVTLTTSIPKETVSPIDIFSDNPDCATINPETGEVKAIAPGSATIIARTFNGQSAECQVTVYDVADHVEISETEHALGVGEAFTLKARPMSGDVALDSPLTYTTANKAIAVVDANGKVTGKKKGVTTIKVTAMSGASAECTITVGNAPGSISLNSKKAVLGYDAAQGLGMTFQLVPKLPKDTTSVITYKGYNQSVIHVDENGLITAVGVGRTNVSATTYNGKKAQIEVVVKAAPASVKLSKSSLTLGAGDRVVLTASIPAETVSPIEIISDNPDCVAINPETGEVRAIAPGSATIIARTFNGQCAECQVTVYDAADRVEISEAEHALGVGEAFTLKARPMSGDVALDSPMTYATANKAIAVVDANGKVTGKKKGVTTIKVTAMSGASAECTINVGNAPSGLYFAKANLTLAYDEKLGIGEEADLGVKLSNGSVSVVTFSGYSSAIVQVNPDGTLRAVGTGTTKVTGKTYNGKKATCTIKVMPAPQVINLDASDLTLGEGQKYTLKATLPAGTIAVLEYVSSQPEVATISASGLIQANQPGETDITVRTTFNNVMATCHVTVLPAPQELTVQQESFEVGVGETGLGIGARLDGHVVDGGIIYKNNNSRVVKIGTAGEITPLRSGKATVEVSAYTGNLTKKVNIVVHEKPTKVTLSDAQITLELGESRVMKPVLPKGQGGGMTLKSSNPKVASYDEDGTVTSLSVGTTTITAETYNGKSASCKVKVVRPAVEMNLPEELTVAATIYEDIPYEVLDTSGKAYAGPVTATLKPADVAEWKDGRIRGKKVGKTTLTLKAGSIEKSCVINVVSYASLHPMQVIAHRGGKGNYPENTLEAFSHSAELGAVGVELDVHTSLDGVQVVHHDGSFVVNNKTYTISKMTYADLKAVKPTLCTLDEAIEVIDASGLDLHLELKNTGDGAKCVEIVNRHGMKDRTVYFSFFDPQLKQVYEADHDAILGKSVKSVPSVAELQRMKNELHLTIISSNYSKTTQADVNTMHAQGLKVCVWTVNDTANARKYINMGADYMDSDYPTRVPK